VTPQEEAVNMFDPLTLEEPVEKKKTRKAEKAAS
jgi:hypothetical protein